MSLIKKSNELVIPSTVKMMIYGQAGMGKTTVALSAPKPLLLDFDNGVKRVNMAHLDGIDIVQVSSWQDVQQVLQEDLSAYQTIVVDTIGKMMDFIISYKCGTRQPQIKDWGGINAEFSWMTRTLSGLNKHIISLPIATQEKKVMIRCLSLPCVKNPTTLSLPNWICSVILK